MKRLLLLIFLFFSFVSAALQSEHYSQFLTRISTEEGLSQSSVTKIVKDHKGYLWIGTHMGLNRYDGYKVQQFGGPDEVLSQDIISTLFVDQQGYIWVATSYNGLYRVNPHTYQFEQILDNKLNGLSEHISEVIAIAQQDTNTFWFAASELLVKFKLDSHKAEVIHRLETRDDIFRALLVRDANTLLAGSSDGLYKVNLSSNSVTMVKHKPAYIKVEDSENIKVLKTLPTGEVFVGTVEGLFLLPANREGQPKRLFSNLNIWDIEEKQGEYYLATNEGLYKFSIANQDLQLVVQYSESRFATSDNNVIDVYADESNSLWLASRSHGVLNWQYTTQVFKHITTSAPHFLSNDNVWAVHQDKHKMLWIGTDHGLNKVDLDTNTTQTFFATKDQRDSDNTSFVGAIFANSDDPQKLWLMNGNGLMSFDKQTGELTYPKLTLGSEAIVRDRWLGGLWLEDNQNVFFFNELGYFKYNTSTGHIETLHGLSDLDFDLSYGFLGFLPNTNKILLATSGHLYTYDLDSHQRHLIYQVDNYQPQSFNYVSSWLIDSNNILWLAVSGEGLIGLDAKDYSVKHKFDDTNGLQTKYIHSLLADENKGLWLSSQAGLHRLNLSSLHIEQYNTQDGLLSLEFNGFAEARFASGELAFGSPLGVTYFSPEDMQQPQQQRDYKVEISNVDLMSGHDIGLVSNDNQCSLHMPHDAFGLNISFTTLSYSHIDKTYYTLALKGENVNLTWRDYKDSELLLPKLTSGEYQLTIQARHPISGELSDAKTVDISVDHAPWLSPLAKTSYIFLCLVVFGTYVWARNKQSKLLYLANQQTLFSKTRMEIALASSDSGIWGYNKIKGVLHQETLYAELGYSEEEYDNSNVFFVSLIHPAAAVVLKPKWQNFLLGQQEIWDEVYQLRSQSGKWLWFRFVGKAVKWGPDGDPVQFSGTYKNVTADKELEDKAILFGSAFSQINDWVLILDEHFHPLTANDAFFEALGAKSQDNLVALRNFISTLGFGNYKKFKRILKSLSVKDSWQGEEYISTNASDSHPVLIKINAVVDDQNQTRHYVIVISDITVQKEAEEKLRHIAHYDFLTNLPNRKLLHEELQKKTNRKNKFALFFIDLDRFKAINDIHTHSVGDQLLKHVADVLLSLAPTTALVARQSGDEFLILVEDYKSIDELSHLAQSILNKLKQTTTLESLNINVSSSIGISLFPEDSTSANELVQKADVAMLHAKNNGRNQFQFYTLDMNVQAHYRLQLENELKIACENNALTNFYQPIIDTKNGIKTAGCELLLRWFHRGQMISPVEFIPIAEETGLIKPMTINAIEQALKDHKQYFSEIEDFYISINLSPVHLIEEGLSETLLTMLDTYGLSPSTLRFEITETSLLDDLDIALVQLNKLREAGFVLLLDDFGTGYSSMTYLSRFPVNFIKIDKSFILNMDKEANMAIVQSIVYLANKMALTCIAEGVESQEHLMTLHDMQCCKVQGFFFSKPLPIEEFATWLTAQKESKDN